MYHEKLIINEAGDKINIQVSFWLNNDKPVYDVNLSVCKKGKRKFHDPLYLTRDDYSFRALSMPERREFLFKEMLKIVPIEFIDCAKRELHQLLKP